jgi:hypothetical protein
VPGGQGDRSPFLDRGAAQLSVDSIVLSLRTMFDAAAAKGVTVRARAGRARGGQGGVTAPPLD